uniref:Synaptotagmin like 5 n=1 Tax=Leptobrachium leishanense TaxID=445787 RepID=A0A8C5LXK3_9ANUR
MSRNMEILNLSYLLDQERQIILDVLQRDAHIKKIEEKRIRKLKNELLEIRKKGGNRYRIRQDNKKKICVRCQKNLGVIFDRGQVCDCCQLRVCNACRVVDKDRVWKCTVCSKISELRKVTGEWFVEERTKRFKNTTSPGTEVVRKSIMRKSVTAKRFEEEGENSKTDTKENTTNNGTLANAQSAGGTDTRSLKRKNPKLLGKGDDTRSIRSNFDTQSLRSNRSTFRVNGVLDKKIVKPPINGDNISTRSDHDTRSLRSIKSVARSERGSVQSLETSGARSKSRGSTNSARSSLPSKGSKTSGSVPAIQSSPTPSKRSVSSHYSHKSGLENGTRTSTSIPENLSMGHRRIPSNTPSAAVSLVSVASDRSKSEMDLSHGINGENAETISIRSKSVPSGLNGMENLEPEEDIDDLVNSHNSSQMRNAFSEASICSRSSANSDVGDYRNLEVTGEIVLNISYSYRTGALNILVKACRNLAVADEKKNRTDPYVKSYLLPDKSRQSKRKTKVKTNTTNPDFNETLKYVISHTQLQTRTLQLSVLHNDRFGRNSFLGEVSIPLDSFDFENKEDNAYNLEPKVDSAPESTPQYKGEITIGLRYTPPEKCLTLPLEPGTGRLSFIRPRKGSMQIPTGGILDVFVKEARNLTAVKSSSTSDTFVKGHLLPEILKSSKQKTPVVKKTVNPQWNHTFGFTNLQPTDLQIICLELTVWGKESLSSNVFLGGVYLGCGSGNSENGEDMIQGEEQLLWQKMIDNPGTSVEGIIMLRSTMTKHKSNPTKA